MPNRQSAYTIKEQFIIVSSCLIACIFLGGAKIQEKPLSPAENVLGFESRSLKDPLFKLFIQQTAGQKKVDWNTPAWDLELLTLAAFYYHPDLDVARARWKTTIGSIENASSRPNPIFQGQSRYTFNPSSNITPWYLQLFSGFTIETTGKRGNRIDQAKHLAEASRMMIGQTAWQVRSRLRNSLVNHLGALEKTVAIQQQLNFQQDVLKGIQQRVAVGESSPLEITQTQIALEQIQLQAKETERQRQESLTQVAQAIGVTVDVIDSFPLATQWFNQPETVSSVSRLDLRREALLSRADILGLMQEYQASHSALKLAISQRYPDIRVGPGYLWNRGVKFWALPMELVFPTQYNTKGATQEALARRSEVAARFALLQAQVIGEVDRGYITYQKALDKLEAANVLLNQQRRRRQMIQKQVVVGEVDRLTFRLVEIELQTSKLNQIDALTQAQQALGLLEDAIQRPLHTVLPSLEQLQPVPRLGQITP